MWWRRQELCFGVWFAIIVAVGFDLTWCAAAESAMTAGLVGGSAASDLGDAPDSCQETGGLPLAAYPDGTMGNYPTVYRSSLPRSGPLHRNPRTVAYLGQSVTLESEAEEGADEDAVNNIRPLEEASNCDGGDDGLGWPLVLPDGAATTLEYTVTVVSPGPGVMYANIWFDWNRDGDWDDALICPSGLRAPEWAVQNQVVVLTTAGRLGLVTPPFVCWHPAASDPAGLWIRITLSEAPWSAAGSGPARAGSGPLGGYLYGETEDYYLSADRSAGGADYTWRDTSAGSGAEEKLHAPQEGSPTAPVWIPILEDPVWKWSQWPDMTTEGMGIRVDGRDGHKRALTDDFECKSSNCIVGVRLWGAWKNDQKGQITKIRLSIHDNDPVGPAGPDKINTFPKPCPEARWHKEFEPHRFEETLYYIHGAGQWWWDPLTGQSAKPANTRLWQITIDIGPGEAFTQEGQPKAPRVYWLAAEIQTTGGEFGWQTRRSLEHFQGSALWDIQPVVPRIWQELCYPAGHPCVASVQTCVDLAFCFKYAPCAPVPTAQPGSATRCPAVSTKCPPAATQCPTLQTYCPQAQTKCPQEYTKCPVTNTGCPENYTTCPEWHTSCPPASTKCPEKNTTCPSTSTRCPVVSTSCPPQSTKCPAVSTKCPTQSTKCPPKTTECPAVSTSCPSQSTKCPVVSTSCPPKTTKCPMASTQCSPYMTHCPTVQAKAALVSAAGE